MENLSVAKISTKCKINDFELIHKFDYELSESEIDDIVRLYSDAFLSTTKIDKTQIDFMKKSVSRMNTFHWFLIKQSGRVIAMVHLVLNYDNVAMFSLNSKLGENVGSLAVDSKFRRKGLARRLMTELMKCSPEYGIKHLVLEVDRTKQLFIELCHFYTSLGFKPFTSTKTCVYFEFYCQERIWSAFGSPEKNL